jgi:hypothetical protein
MNAFRKNDPHLRRWSTLTQHRRSQRQRNDATANHAKDHTPNHSSLDEIRWDGKAGLRRDAVRSQVIDVLEAQIKRRPAMKKVSTAAIKATKNFSQAKLTIGLDLGDRSSWYCLLDEVGEVLQEQKLGTTQKAMREVFGSMPRCRIALETGMHSPWVSRVLGELGHEEKAIALIVFQA